MIYLDNAATTKIHPDVLAEMMPYLTEEYGNVGGLYQLGANAMEAVELARERVAGFLNTSPRNIIFTSGGCESNTLALSVASIYADRPRIGTTRGILTSKSEHDSVLNAANAYNDRYAAFPCYLETDISGMAQVDQNTKYMVNDSALVSMMYENNETGIVNDVYEMGDICYECGVVFHVDAVQAAGHIPIDVEHIGCDLLSISSHKIHGPKGVGALYVSDRILNKLRPCIYGGSNQEWGKRGGTENVAGIVGFGKACQRLTGHENEYRQRFDRLQDCFCSELESNLSVDAWRINGDWKYNGGKTVNYCFPNVDAETLILMLSNDGICVSAGSACTSHESKPSHVLKAMGLSDEDARSSIRVSFSEFNTEPELRAAAKRVAERVSELGEANNEN